MTDENLQPLERIPRPEVYEIPWFDYVSSDSGSGAGETMEL